MITFELSDDLSQGRLPEYQPVVFPCLNLLNIDWPHVRKTGARLIIPLITFIHTLAINLDSALQTPLLKRHRSAIAR
jgi:hypothetical protein